MEFSFSTIRSFFTPTVLFLLLNLVIATIVAINSLNRHRRHVATAGSGDEPHRPIARSSSSNVLERVRSIGLFRFRSGDLPPISDDHSDLQPQPTAPPESVEIEHESHRQQQQQQQFRRIQSESDSISKTATVMEDVEEKVGRMKKSLSAMTWRSSGSETAFVRRPAAAERLRREASVDEEVDAKADDFINRFKQQLKLQRLDSIFRYKEMLTNGK